MPSRTSAGGCSFIEAEWFPVLGPYPFSSYMKLNLDPVGCCTPGSSRQRPLESSQVATESSHLLTYKFRIVTNLVYQFIYRYFENIPKGILLYTVVKIGAATTYSIFLGRYHAVTLARYKKVVTFSNLRYNVIIH